MLQISSVTLTLALRFSLCRMLFNLFCMLAFFALCFTLDIAFMLGVNSLDSLRLLPIP